MPTVDFGILLYILTAAVAVFFVCYAFMLYHDGPFPNNQIKEMERHMNKIKDIDDNISKIIENNNHHSVDEIAHNTILESQREKRKESIEALHKTYNSLFLKLKHDTQISYGVNRTIEHLNSISTGKNKEVIAEVRKVLSDDGLEVDPEKIQGRRSMSLDEKLGRRVMGDEL